MVGESNSPHLFFLTLKRDKMTKEKLQDVKEKFTERIEQEQDEDRRLYLLDLLNEVKEYERMVDEGIL